MTIVSYSVVVNVSTPDVYVITEADDSVLIAVHHLEGGMFRSITACESEMVVS